VSENAQIVTASLHTETYIIACTDLLINSDHKTKPDQSDLPYWSKCLRKSGREYEFSC